MAHTPQSALARYQALSKRRVMLAIPFYAGAGLAVLGLAFTIFDRFILKTGLPSWITILVFATDSALVLWLQKRINEYTGAMKSLNDRYDLKQDEHQ